MNRTRRAAAITAAAATLITLAACSTPAGSGPPVILSPQATATAPAAAPAPADPVALLKRTGATPDPGTVHGEHDVYGDRYASGDFPGGEHVTVYTAADLAAYRHLLGVWQPDDTTGIVGVPASRAVIELTATTDGWGGPAPAAVAARVGGQEVTS